jgi:hypothetical protein
LFFSIRFKKQDKEGWKDFSIFICIIGFLISIVMGISAITDYHSIKEQIIKIEVIQDVIQSDNVLDLKDINVIPNLNPDILLEKKIEYNELIIGWKNDNKWWKSGIYIPDVVDELKLIN